MRTWLVDTGPFVAYLDRADPAHGSVAQAFDGFSGRLLTTSAVITEAMHLLEASPDGPMSLAEFVQTADIHIAESTQAAELIRAASLMRTYSDTPMDFADATLVLLADQTGVHEMLTLDRRGFSTYRTAKNHRFRLVISEH
jgi:predicted nucleic acid-binding protein